jgi:hypothetical protein
MCMCYLWCERGGGTAYTAVLSVKASLSRAGGGSSTQCATRRWRARWWWTWSR